MIRNDRSAKTVVHPKQLWVVELHSLVERCTSKKYRTILVFFCLLDVDGCLETIRLLLCERRHLTEIRFSVKGNKKGGLVGTSAVARCPMTTAATVSLIPCATLVALKNHNPSTPGI